MSYTFRVIFDGVLAYVPNKPFFMPCDDLTYPDCGEHKCCTGEGERRVCYRCRRHEGCWKRRDNKIDDNDPKSGPVESLAVLIPDLRRPGSPRVPGYSHMPCQPDIYCEPSRAELGKKHHLKFPRFREPHFPLLKFRLSDLRASTTRRVDLVCRDISRQDEEGILFLRREQIRFDMDAENAEDFSFAGWAPCPPPSFDKLEDCYKRLRRPPKWWGKTPDLRDREQLESLWWLPDLGRIIPKSLYPDYQAAIQAKPEVLPSYRGPFPEGLIARIECSGGRLRTYDFNRDVDGVPVVWNFVPPSDFRKITWKRALANSLALEFFDVRDEVRIQLKRLANEVVVEELVLAPGPGASRPLLEIEITNREPDLLFQEESFNRSALPDMDFQPFYELLSQAKRQDILHLPIPYPSRESFFGVVEKPCAGSGMIGQGG